MSYKVKLDIFEGPFDLLVYLIENAEMNIYDIQVSKITNQYLAYIDQMKTLDVTLASEFMVLAAALIEIKSKMLLPRIKSEGEGLIDEDPRAELVQRILEYKRFKIRAEYLEQQQELNQRIFVKPKEDLSSYIGEPDEYIILDLNQFINTFHLFLQKRKKIEEVKKKYTSVERQRISIESRIDYIKSQFLFKDKKKLSFTDLLGTGRDRYEIVLTFVSLLEMIRQKTIVAKQNFNFGEITLSLDPRSTASGSGNAGKRGES